MQEATKSAAVEAGAGRPERMLVILVIIALVALAIGFWKANGAQVFAELMSSAWSLCF